MPIDSGFGVESFRRGTAVRVALRGELDAAQAPHLREHLRPLEDELRVQPMPDGVRVVIDLSGLTFVDSAGIRALLGVNQRMRSEAVNVAFIAGPENVRRVLALTGVDKRLQFVKESESPA